MFRKIWRDLKWLAEVIDELSQHWQDRVLPANRLPHAFNGSATCCLDTFPIRINRPTDRVLNRLVFQGKYRFHCLKVVHLKSICLIATHVSGCFCHCDTTAAITITATTYYYYHYTLPLLLELQLLLLLVVLPRLPVTILYDVVSQTPIQFVGICSYFFASHQVQLICDHSGVPIWFSGPHLGNIPDPNLFVTYHAPLAAGE